MLLKLRHLSEQILPLPLFIGSAIHIFFLKRALPNLLKHFWKFSRYFVFLPAPLRGNIDWTWLFLKIFQSLARGWPAPRLFSLNFIDNFILTAPLTQSIFSEMQSVLVDKNTFIFCNLESVHGDINTYIICNPESVHCYINTFIFCNQEPVPNSLRDPF